jgi:hypothetical protein
MTLYDYIIITFFFFFFFFYFYFTISIIKSKFKVSLNECKYYLQCIQFLKYLKIIYHNRY